MDKPPNQWKLLNDLEYHVVNKFRDNKHTGKIYEVGKSHQNLMEFTSLWWHNPSLLFYSVEKQKVVGNSISWLNRERWAQIFKWNTVISLLMTLKIGSNNCEHDITLNEQSTLMTYMMELKPWHFPICPIRIDFRILWWHMSRTNIYKNIHKKNSQDMFQLI